VKPLVPIGALSRRSGVPVKTIRFYSDAGLLPPAAVTASRYRLYGEDAWVQLDLIRALRALGFDLATIQQLVAQRRTAGEAIRLQIAAIDAEMRRLRRARAVLSRAADVPEEAALAALRARLAVAMLDRAERETFLRGALAGHLAGVGVDPGWLAWLHETAFAGLPEDLSETQWSALLELAELVQDEDFGRRLATQARGFWTAAAGRFDLEAWQAAMAGLVKDASAALAASTPLDDPVARELAERLLGTFASAMGKRPTPAFARRLVKDAGEHDPRAERFWELVAVLRGWPGPPPHARAFRWLFQALAARYAPSRPPRATRRRP
jgi:DNA-binding transcriptional MerR regulator